MTPAGDLLASRKTHREWVTEHFASLKAAAAGVSHIHPEVVEDGPHWSVLKHLAIHNSLGMYLAIMSRQRWAKELYYVDTNSSCGISLLRKTTFKVAGSSLIGATTTTPFHHYFFVEPDPQKHVALTERLDAVLPAGKFTVYSERADSAIPKIMAQIPQRDAHYFAVVDPYNMSGISWGGLSALMSHDRGDILMNFQTTQVKRVTNEIAEAVYGDGRVIEYRDRQASEEEMLALFLDRMRTRRPVTETIRVRSGTNRYYYDLIYASAATRGDNPWMKMVRSLKKRVESLDGKRVIDILQTRDLGEYF